MYFHSLRSIGSPVRLPFVFVMYAKKYVQKSVQYSHFKKNSS